MPYVHGMHSIHSMHACRMHFAAYMPHALRASAQFYLCRKTSATHADDAGLLNEFAQSGRFGFQVVDGGLLFVRAAVLAVCLNDDTVFPYTGRVRDKALLNSDDSARAGCMCGDTERLGCFCNNLTLVNSVSRFYQALGRFADVLL